MIIDVVVLVNEVLVTLLVMMQMAMVSCLYCRDESSSQYRGYVPACLN